MSTYAIADRLPLEARRVAASRQYRHRDPELDAPRTVAGYCPLGVALRAMHVKAPKDPLPEDVANALAAEDDRLWDAIYDAAVAFIHDWDDLAIQDLADALGVREQSA